MNTVAENPSREVSEQKHIENKQQSAMPAENLASEAENVQEDSGEQNQSLDMVRNILFGEQARQTEKRQASLERYIQASVASLNEKTSKKIDALKGEISLLTDLLEEESQARKAEMLRHEANMNEVEQSIDKLGHQVLKNHSEMNDRLDNEKNRLGVQMTDWREELLQKLQDTSNKLGNEKADRQSIAVLLTEMADQLVTDKPVAG